MITKFDKFINESLLDKMKGKDKEEVWKNLGYDKAFDTPEEFFLYVIKGMKIKEQNKCHKSVFWEKNGEILFEQDFDTGYLFVSYDKIWKIFETIFNIDYYDIIALIKGVVDKHLNWNGLAIGTL